MIKANELRIENFISISPIYHKDDIRIVYLKMLNAIENGFEVFGIPLTEDILLKLGFVSTSIQGDILTLFLSDSDKNEFSRQRIDFWKNNQDGKVELCRGGVCFKMVICKYVHQLQNIYFALTGEELQINLNTL